MFMLTAFLQTDNRSMDCDYFSIYIELIDLQFINETWNRLTKVHGG